MTSAPRHLARRALPGLLAAAALVLAPVANATATQKITSTDENSTVTLQIIGGDKEVHSSGGDVQITVVPSKPGPAAKPRPHRAAHPAVRPHGPKHKKDAGRKGACNAKHDPHGCAVVVANPSFTG